MKELVEISDNRIKWCNSFLMRCINFMLKTEPVDSDGFPSIKQLNHFLKN